MSYRVSLAKPLLWKEARLAGERGESIGEHTKQGSADTLDVVDFRLRALLSSQVGTGVHGVGQEGEGQRGRCCHLGWPPWKELLVAE